MLSAIASRSATCAQFEKKLPSVCVRAVSLAHMAADSSRPLLGHTGIYGVFVKTMTFCLVKEVDRFSHSTGFHAVAKACFRNSKRHHL